MELGIVGLGRMGSNIARRLLRAGHHCVVFDTNPAQVNELQDEGAVGATSITELIARLHQTPKAVWVMLPAGEVTEQTISRLAELLSRDDIVIDGGNSFYRDDIRRAEALRAVGVNYIDVGTSGGVWGLERGYCLMIGGPDEAVRALDPIFAALAPGAGTIAQTPDREGRDPRVAQGYLHAGPVGAGHFVKMIHNGIEYGMMQAYAEGFDILRHRADDSVSAPERFAIDLADVAEVWRRGSVISSWLLDLTASALARDPQLATFSGHVSDSGEGRWTLDAAIEEAVPAGVLAAALFARFRSRDQQVFADRMLSAMRFAFGGHLEPRP